MQIHYNKTIRKKNILEVNDDNTINTKISDGTDTADVIPTNGHKGLVAIAPGHVSTVNSTTTILGNGGVFTGEWEEITNFGVIVVTVFADQDSATDGLCIETSTDGINAIGTDCPDQYTVPANKTKTFTNQTLTKYYRIKYTNGTTPQTVFKLQTVLKPYYVKPSSHRIQDVISDDDDAELTKSVITGKTAAGTFVNGSFTNNGNFKNSIEELENDVSEDSNTTLRTTNILADEFGTVGRALTDNYFQGATVVVDEEHHEIHCGDSYEASDNVTLGNGASRDYLIIVPNEGITPSANPGADQEKKQWHYLPLVAPAAEITMEIYEAADRVAGTAITSYNRNRNCTNNDVLNISHTPTGGTTDGTRIWGPWRVGEGRTGAGELKRNRELVLKDNTKYILRITNQTTTDNNVNTEHDYYVHPGV
jgi:hypothetical protein